MTPNDIGILIHCHCCPEPHPRLEAGAVRASLVWMANSGLIEQVDKERWKTTPRGAAHLNQLCNLPLPRRAWIGADGETIQVE